MKKLSSEQLQVLAAEYVMGSLQGAARKRFERMMMESYRVRQEVWSWEQQLAVLAVQLPEQTPSRAVWRGINARIKTTSSEKAGAWEWLLSPWKAVLTSAFLVLVVTVSVTTVSFQESSKPGISLAQPRYVAVFSEPDSNEVLWTVNVREDGQLILASQGATTPPSQNSYELWLLPDGGMAPQSLGLLPASGVRTDRVLDAAKQQLMAKAAGLAVSLEPEGGSTSGAPSGPVLYQARLLTL